MGNLEGDEKRGSRNKKLERGDMERKGRGGKRQEVK